LNQRELVSSSLPSSVELLDPVLRPLGFRFQSEPSQASHTGPYASGYYVRGETYIGLCFHERLQNVVYAHSFVTKHPSCFEIERFTMNHTLLMNCIGASAKCALIPTDEFHENLITRNGENDISALVNDIVSFVVPCLSEPDPSFFDVIRLGLRNFYVA
jgi:hypothetical protein